MREYLWLAMSNHHRLAGLSPLLLAVVLSAGVAACSSSATPSPPTGTETKPTEPPPPASTTPALRVAIDPTILSTLTSGGLDIKNLPDDLETIVTDRDKIHAVMTSFTIALGTTCEGCHVKAGAKLDFKADSEKKKIAKGMWTNFVRALKNKDGSAIYCDSCHQGKMQFLDRADNRSLGAWMKVNFVDKLARVDGKDHSCATCHGTPFDGSFIDKWNK